MSVWADNIKFVMDIIDSKLAKIDHAIHEIEEGKVALEADSKCGHGKEKFTFAVRNLELVQPQEIEMLMDTILSDLHENEKKNLQHVVAEKLSKRSETLGQSKEFKSKHNLV